MPSYFLLEDSTKLLLEDVSFLLTEEPGSYTATGTISGVGSISASGYRTAFRSGSISGNGQISSTGYRTRFGSASISGTGTISASGFKTRFGSVTITGTGLINATGEGFRIVARPTLTGVGSHRLWQRSRSITLT